MTRRNLCLALLASLACSVPALALVVADDRVPARACCRPGDRDDCCSNKGAGADGCVGKGCCKGGDCCHAALDQVARPCCEIGTKDACCSKKDAASGLCCKGKDHPGCAGGHACHAAAAIAAAKPCCTPGKSADCCPKAAAGADCCRVKATSKDADKAVAGARPKADCVGGKCCRAALEKLPAPPRIGHRD